MSLPAAAGFFFLPLAVASHHSIRERAIRLRTARGSPAGLDNFRRVAVRPCRGTEDRPECRLPCGAARWTQARGRAGADRLLREGPPSSAPEHLRGKPGPPPLDHRAVATPERTGLSQKNYGLNRGEPYTDKEWLEVAGSTEEEIQQIENGDMVI